MIYKMINDFHSELKKEIRRKTAKEEKAIAFLVENLMCYYFNDSKKEIFKYVANHVKDTEIIDLLELYYDSLDLFNRVKERT